MATPLAIPLSTHTFRQPKKLINNNEDLPHFLKSKAHHLIVSYIQHFSNAVTPEGSDTKSTESRYADSPAIAVSHAVSQIVELLATIGAIIDEVPPVEGPRRFGNVAFRTWHATVESRSLELLQKYLPESIVNTPAKEDGVSALEELKVYLLGGFGSAQRLDYGTGHELSFFAFLCGIWVLGGFETGKDELALIFKAFDAYLNLIRKLVLTYTLEPAGSHGVWGLDDHSFLPYIFGSAQLAATPEGMGPPAPGSIIQDSTVERERGRNLYFAAIGFIKDVKRGPFWEHSPYLYDISGAIGGWKKINQGMMKMYAAEVLGKFPVVQHFPFGSIFSWDLVEGTELPTGFPSVSATPTQASGGGEGTKAPWSTIPSDPSQTTSVPTTRMRVSTPVSQSNVANQAPISALRGPPTRMPPPFARPQAASQPPNITLNPETTTTVPVPGGFAPAIGGVAVTTAPWAKAPTGPSGFGKGSGGGEAVGLEPNYPDSVAEVGAPVRRARSGSVTVGETGSLAGGKVVEYMNSHNQNQEEAK
ncbi:Serine/threonine-protein phosphatase 2A activator 1 [Orbilia blumenaviensis]|uniref:Serine/threonine-protein phosphatase 2A activator n=1 Tax=Orbilia blumenaviensis TaxID=1796055 RepID=A0AAV9VHZ1_9PEZI